MGASIRISLAPYGLENQFVEITGAQNQPKRVQEAARRALDLLTPRLERMDQRNVHQRVRLIQTELPDLIKRVDSTTRFTGLTVASGTISSEEEEAFLGRFDRLKDAQYAVERALKKHFPANKPFSSPEQKQRFWTRAMGQVLQELQCSAALTAEDKADRIVILANLYRDGCVVPLPPHSYILESPTLEEYSGLPQEPPPPLHLNKASAEFVRHAILSPSVVWAAKICSEAHSVRIEDLDRIRHVLGCSQDDALRCIALCLKASDQLPFAFDETFALNKNLQRYCNQLLNPPIKDSALAKAWEKTLIEPERLASAIESIWSSLSTTHQDSSYLTTQLKVLERHAEMLESSWEELANTIRSPRLPTHDLHLVGQYIKSAATNAVELEATTATLNQLIHQLDQALPIFPELSALRSLPAMIGGQSLEFSLKQLLQRVQSSREALGALHPLSDDRPKWLKVLLAIFTLFIATAISYFMRALPYKREKKRLEGLLQSDLIQAQSALQRTSLALTKWKSSSAKKNEPEIRKAAQELFSLSLELRHLTAAITHREDPPTPEHLAIELGYLGRLAGTPPSNDSSGIQLDVYAFCAQSSQSPNQIKKDGTELAKRLWKPVQAELNNLTTNSDEESFGIDRLFEDESERSSLLRRAAQTIQSETQALEKIEDILLRTLTGPFLTEALDRLEQFRMKFFRNILNLPEDSLGDLLAQPASESWRLQLPLTQDLDTGTLELKILKFCSPRKIVHDSQTEKEACVARLWAPVVQTPNFDKKIEVLKNELTLLNTAEARFRLIYTNESELNTALNQLALLRTGLFDRVFRLKEEERIQLDRCAESANERWLLEIPSWKASQEPEQESIAWITYIKILRDLAPDSADRLVIQLIYNESDRSHQFQLCIGTDVVFESSKLSASMTRRVRARAAEIKVSHTLQLYSEALSFDNFITANLQTMTDHEDLRNYIHTHLDEVFFSRENFKEIRTTEADPPVFAACFEDRAGIHRELIFSNRTGASEFRGARLQQALTNASYSNLRELIGSRYGTPQDSLLLYALTPLKQDTDVFPETRALDSAPTPQEIIHATATELHQIPVKNTFLDLILGSSPADPSSARESNESIDQLRASFLDQSIQEGWLNGLTSPSESTRLESQEAIQNMLMSSLLNRTPPVADRLNNFLKLIYDDSKCAEALMPGKRSRETRNQFSLLLQRTFQQLLNQQSISTFEETAPICNHLLDLLVNNRIPENVRNKFAKACEENLTKCGRELFFDNPHRHEWLLYSALTATVAQAQDTWLTDLLDENPSHKETLARLRGLAINSLNSSLYIDPILRPGFIQSLMTSAIQNGHLQHPFLAISLLTYLLKKDLPEEAKKAATSEIVNSLKTYLESDISSDSDKLISIIREINAYFNIFSPADNLRSSDYLQVMENILITLFSDYSNHLDSVKTILENYWNRTKESLRRATHNETEEALMAASSPPMIAPVQSKPTVGRLIGVIKSFEEFLNQQYRNLADLRILQKLGTICTALDFPYRDAAIPVLQSWANEREREITYLEESLRAFEPFRRHLERLAMPAEEIRAMPLETAQQEALSLAQEFAEIWYSDAVQNRFLEGHMPTSLQRMVQDKNNEAHLQFNQTAINRFPPDSDILSQMLSGNDLFDGLPDKVGIYDRNDPNKPFTRMLELTPESIRGQALRGVTQWPMEIAAIRDNLQKLVPHAVPLIEPALKETMAMGKTSDLLNPLYAALESVQRRLQ